MKIKTKRNYLLWFLLSTFLIIWIINVTIGEKTIIDTKPDISKLHTISLRSLFLGSGDFDTWFSWMRVNTWWSSLDVLNGLIVWSGNLVSQWSKMVVIGWGEWNKIEDSNAWIAWWKNNRVESSNWAIGGWLGNRWDWVIAGGRENIAGGSAIVLWWRRNWKLNSYANGIILWGSGNDAKIGAVVFWQRARWEDMSFAWNAKAWINSARINASGWMLIGTNTPVSWVYLVVDWSVKLWSGKFDSTTWWVWVNENGCIKASDGDSLYTLGRSSESVCGVDSGCQFGTTILHNGDKVTAYTVSYAKKCEDIAQTVTCKGWKFYNSGGSIMNVVYPYCYDLSPDPILTLTWWIKQCSWTLPANTIPVNEYFKQNLQNGGWTPPNKSRSYYYNDVNKECSYKCDTENGYSWNDAVYKCELQTYNCGWTKPTWNGYKFWTWIYTYGYTPTSWTYYTGGTLWPCLYKCDTGYIWSGGKCVEPVYQCTWTPPSHATLLAWSDNWLTVNTERKLYASATEANWKKCAYLCDTWSNYYYDGWKCKFISNFCLPEVYGCLMPATATHTWYSDNKYTWDCKIDWISEPVEEWCFLTLQCHHCSKSGFPYCFPINFDSTCNEGNYLN